METDNRIEVSIVMPCLNEAETLAVCLRKAKACIEEHNLSAEIIVADNGSTDGSQDIAAREGARVVDVVEKGYGNAVRGGIAAARGRYIIMGDADDSYDFSAIYPFIEELRRGADLVMGSRFKGGIKPGAMPWKNRYIGNPIQTRIGRVFFRCPITDFNCGLRAFSREAYERMELVTTTWEFASEMVVKAAVKGMRIAEVPVVLHKDGRSRRPHLQPWRAGWRNLRFMLLYSPRWLFLIPGLMLFGLGLLGFVLLLPGPRLVHGTVFHINTLVVCSAACLVGFQVVSFGILARAFAVSEGLLPPNRRSAWLQRHFRLEIGIVAGLTQVLVGIGLMIAAVVMWSGKSFGPLGPNEYARIMRIVIPATTLLALGAQSIFTSFFMSVLGMGRKHWHPL